MSKIWLLLLLVGAIQFASTFPTPDEEESDFFDVSSFQLEDVSDEEERNAVGDWFKKQWDKVKKQFKKVSAKCKAAFDKGRDILKKKGIKVDPLNCSEKTCKSCIDFTLKKRKFCVEMEFSNTAIRISLTKQKDEEEPEAMIGPLNINLGNVPTCKSLGKVIGPICLQGVEARLKSSKGKPFMNFCAGALLKNWGIGAKFCIGLEDGKFSMKFKPKVFPGDEEKESIMEAGDKPDEGKELDAVPI